MIYTQRKLIERIAEHDGCPPPQPHFSAAMETLGGRPITPHQYINLQLKMHLLKEDMSVIDVLGMQIDPEGHDLYQGEDTLCQSVSECVMAVCESICGIRYSDILIRCVYEVCGSL